MRILVMGAGVVGVTTAYELLRDGHEVMIVDRESEPASFTSYANAGLIAPGHAYAWASPRAPAMMLKSLWNADQAIRFKPSLSPRLWRWTIQFLRQCNRAAAATNTRAKARLCRYSQRQLERVTHDLRLAYDGRDNGLVYFYRSAANFEAAGAKCELLRNEGIEIHALDVPELIALDPGLRPAHDKIAGALYVPSDASGDARLFTRILADACRREGASFHMLTSIDRIVADAGRVVAIETNQGRMDADAYVLALGVYSPHVVEPLGIRLPIYPIKGYSVTLPVDAHHHPPELGGVDEDNLLAYCPFGNRLRLTAIAEFAGYATSHQPRDFAPMIAKARELFPHAADYEAPDYWAGLRPMTPTGLPIVGSSPLNNLWLNTGHGHMGWTMAAGCARILADQLNRSDTGVDVAALAYAA